LDNIRFLSRIYRRPAAEMIERVDEFAALGKALGMPIKHYSSGMRARLAFGLSIAIEFDCYLIDEVIMVGDRRFTQRCQEELFEKRADRSIILVSHDMNFIRTVCDSAAVIHNSQFEMCDSVMDAVALYERL
jgi:capsular polysaccharide transport system ATP-binding protein